VGATRFLRTFSVSDVVVRKTSPEGEGTLGRVDGDGGETRVGFAGDTGSCGGGEGRWVLTGEMWRGGGRVPE